MSIISLKFLAFLTITLFAYYIVPRRFQWWVLLIASGVFYALAGIQYIVFVAASILISFFGAKLISELLTRQKMESEGMEKTERRRRKAEVKRKCRGILVCNLTVVISFLAILKYSNFAIVNFNVLLSALNAPRLSTLDLVLPLGISFYTFQIVAYLVDVYRGKFKAEQNLARYALFVLFFPQITEGPIARYDQLSPQLFGQKEFDYDNLRFGAQLMIWGFFKKIVIADRLALMVNNVYGNEAKYSGPVFLLATAFFSIEIYADFSGCMDIVTGAAEMFGIKLAPNFNHPYFSRTIPEFWRRWHISLSSWFRDYVFYPVAASGLSLKLNKGARRFFGNKAGRIISSCFPVLVVWMLTGLWHGAQWNFVAWGIFYGVLIILSMVLEPVYRKLDALLHIRTESFGWRLFQMVRTFFICTIARVFFRANSLPDALLIFSKMFGAWRVPGGFFSLGMDRADFAVAVVSMLVLLTVSILQEHMNIRKRLSERSLVLKWGVYLTALFVVIVFGVYGSTNSGTSFIYERF